MTEENSHHSTGRRFPTLAIAVLIVGVFWLLAELKWISVEVIWIPVVLIIIAVGWIAFSFRKKG